MLKKYIITLEENLKGDKTKKSYNYNKFDYLNLTKKIILMILFILVNNIYIKYCFNKIKSNKKKISKCISIYITLKKRKLLYRLGA